MHDLRKWNQKSWSEKEYDIARFATKTAINAAVNALIPVPGGGAAAAAVEHQIEKQAVKEVEKQIEKEAARAAEEAAAKEAKEVAEREARARLEQEAKARAEREAREKAEQEARERAERAAKERAEHHVTEPETQLAPYDPQFAAQQMLGHPPVTPNGRVITPHAAERMVKPPSGRSSMSVHEVDEVLNKGTRIKKVTPHPEGATVTVQHPGLPGKPQVVVDAETGKRVITVIKNR